MRIPGSDVYRAFPELDRFSDEQCREYVRLARRRRWLARSLALVAQGVIAFVGLNLVLIGTIVVLHAFEEGLRGRASRAALDLTAIGVIVAISLPCLLAIMLIRDAVLRKTIRLQLARVDCHRCRYTLLGVPVVEGAITCPECGFVLELATFGLTPEDFIASGGAAHAGADGGSAARPSRPDAESSSQRDPRR